MEDLRQYLADEVQHAILVGASTATIRVEGEQYTFISLPEPQRAGTEAQQRAYAAQAAIKLVNQKLLSHEVNEIALPSGDFVNDGSRYQFMDYVFQSTIDDEGFSSLDVYDFEENHMGELGGVALPDEDDREAILNFESLLTTWLKGQGLI